MASAGAWAATRTDPRLPSPLCQDELWRTTGAAFHQRHPHRGLSGDSPSVAGSNLFMHAWWNSPLTHARAQTAGIELNAGVVVLDTERWMHFKGIFMIELYSFYKTRQRLNMWPWGLHSSKSSDPNICSPGLRQDQVSVFTNRPKNVQASCND